MRSRDLVSAHVASLKSEICMNTIVKHLNQIELSRRWGISPRTLERWRWRQEGPGYLKIGGHIAYRVEDIEAFEVATLRRPAVQATSNRQSK